MTPEGNEWARATSTWTPAQHKADRELVAAAEAEARRAVHEDEDEEFDPFASCRWDDPEELDWEPNPVVPAPKLRVVQPTNYRAGIRRDRGRRAA